MAELAAEAPPEADDWLVERLLPVDGISLLVAPPKVEKSTLARTLAAAIAAGRTEWLGRPLTKQGVVIHLALEERPRTVLGHYERLGAHAGRIHLLAGRAPPKQRDSMLRRSIETRKPVLVIIDPLQRWVRILDMNAYAETTEALTPLIGLARECGAHVMLVHHSRKSGGEHGQEALGSTSLAGSVDTILSLKRRGDGRTITSTGRDGADMEETVLTMDERGWVTAAGTKAEADGGSLADRVWEYLQGIGEEQTAQDIIDSLKVRKTRVYAALRQLTEEQRIVQTGSGQGSGNASRYSVPGSQHI